MYLVISILLRLLDELPRALSPHHTGTSTHSRRAPHRQTDRRTDTRVIQTPKTLTRAGFVKIERERTAADATREFFRLNLALVYGVSLRRSVQAHRRVVAGLSGRRRRRNVARATSVSLSAPRHRDQQRVLTRGILPGSSMRNSASARTKCRTVTSGTCR